jgi:lysophospholipase L1-like esterase
LDERVHFVGDSHGGALLPRLQKLLPGVSGVFNNGWSEAKYRGVTLPGTDVVVYQLGGNNYHLSEADYRKDVAALLLAARGKKVLWVGPAFATDPATAKRHEATADMQKRILREHGVPWFDSRAVTRTGHRSDGVHFDAAAYDRWAAAVAAWATARPNRGTWWLVGAAAAALVLLGAFRRSK